VSSPIHNYAVLIDGKSFSSNSRPLHLEKLPLYRDSKVGSDPFFSTMRVTPIQDETAPSAICHLHLPSAI